MRRQGVGAVVLTLIVAGATSAPAQTEQQKDWCFKHGFSSEQVIQGCTAVLQASQTSPDRRAQAHLNRGRIYFERGDFDRALAEADQAIRLKPDYAGAYAARCALHRARRAYDRAIADCDQAIRLNPQEGLALANRGAIHLELVEYDRTIADLDHAICLDPRDAKAFADRGVAWHKGQHDRAIADLDQAIRLDPTSGPAYNSRCLCRAIMVQAAQALPDCEEALQLLTDEPDVLNSLGFAHLKMGNFDRAIAAYNAALRKEPRSASSLYDRGLATLKKGDRLGSNADLAAARIIDPGIDERYAGFGVRP